MENKELGDSVFFNEKDQDEFIQKGLIELKPFLKITIGVLAAGFVGLAVLILIRTKKGKRKNEKD